MTITAEERTRKAEAKTKAQELKPKNRFEILSAINVNEHTEKKNNLTYLSWAWAWQVFKRLYPESYYTIYENAEGLNYFHDNKTCWVKTGVTLVDEDFSLEHIEMLPVMDFRNASIPKDKVTSMDVNKAIQRSLTKAIARHGLGCYIYAGEDLPEETEDEKAVREAAEKQLEVLRADVDKEVKRITAQFDNAAKMNFAKKHIVPVIGQPNYKTCNDNDKLSELLEKLKAA